MTSEQRNPTKNKYNVQYSHEELRKALHDIRVDGKGIRETCRLYGIPRTTIQDRLSGKRRDAFDDSPDPVLGEDETQMTSEQRNPTKNKYNVQYSYEELRKALHDIRVDGKGIRETCRLYGIPRTTIQDRLSGKRRDAFDDSPDPVLGEDETQNDEPMRSERYSLMEDEDWRTRGGSIIWNHTQERSVTRVKCRATTCQLVQLVKFMEKHPELAVSHSRPFPGSDELWMELAEHINQFGPPKNYKQCKTTWRDLRKRAFAMQRGRNKKGTGRNLYGMAPKIVSLITAAGGGAPKIKQKNEDEEEGCASSSKPADSPTPPPEQPAPVGDETGVIKVERTAGDQLVIRVTDKLDSKTNVFNRFTISDGHFENNITVKEEIEDKFNQEEDSEPADTEVEIEPHDRSEEMFPPAEAILGDADVVMGEKNSVLMDLNDTLRKFLLEYKTRNSLMRERIDLERARLQFDMEVYRSRQQDRRQDTGKTNNEQK